MHCRYSLAIKRPELRKRAAKRLTAQDDVKAAAPAVAAMGAANGSDFLSVARRREPIVDGSANAPALDRRSAGTSVAGNQQQHPFAVNERLLQRPVDRLPGTLQVVAVEVDDPVGLH
jgi:hypothetical protein